MRAAVSVLTVALVSHGTMAAAADALTIADEHLLRGTVIIACHPNQSEEDLAYLDQAEMVGHAAFEFLWAQLDKANPTYHVENGRKADEMIQVRIATAIQKAQDRIKREGCAELDKQTAPTR